MKGVKEERRGQWNKGGRGGKRSPRIDADDNGRKSSDHYTQSVSITWSKGDPMLTKNEIEKKKKMVTGPLYDDVTMLAH